MNPLNIHALFPCDVPMHVCYKLLCIIVITVIVHLLEVYNQKIVKEFNNNRPASQRNVHEMEEIMEDKLRNVFWFMQISDTHISINNDTAAENLKYFIKSIVPKINPDFIVHTGDITDAKVTLSEADQVEKEWQTYADIIKDCKVEWLDMRGNHDCFNVFGNQNNYFNQYSSQKETSYVKSFSKDDGTYSLVAFDSCPKYGTKRLFNFFGYTNQQEAEKLASNLESVKDSSHIIVASHYPLITNVFHQSFDFNNFKNVSIYINGHLHNNMIRNRKLYARQSGFLELELGDMKKLSAFRIVVIDHNMISFLDAFNDEKSFVVLTNPKNCEYILNDREPWESIKKSKYIRMMVFGQVTRIFAEIDGTFYSEIKPLEGDLWGCKWNPNYYSNGIHTIKLKIYENETDFYEKTSTFSVDGTLAKWSTSKLLSISVLKITRILFYCLNVFLLLIFVISKLYSNSIDFNSWTQLKRIELKNIGFSFLYLHIYFKRSFKRLIYGLVIFSHSTMFWIHLLFLVYRLIGPWHIGRFVTNLPYSFSFLYGIYSDYQFYPLIDGFVFYTIGSFLRDIVYYSLLFRRASQNLTRKKLEIFNILLFLWYFLIDSIIFLLFLVSFGFDCTLLSPMQVLYSVVCYYSLYKPNNLKIKIK